MSNKFVILLIMLSILLVGCSEHCADFDDYYTKAEADSAYFAYAESPEFMNFGDSVRLKKDSYIYDAFWNAEYVSISVWYEGDGLKLKNGLYVDVYGCRTRKCPEANTVVIHNDDYSYEELVLPPKFEVSKGKSLQVREDYESKTIDFQFHLRLKTETAYLSAYVEIGRGYYEQCSSGWKPGGW